MKRRSKNSWIGCGAKNIRSREGRFSCFIDTKTAFLLKILLVAATEIETAWLRQQAKWEVVEEGLWRTHLNRVRIGEERTSFTYTLDLLVTGIGMVNTAYRLGSYLTEQKPRLVVNFGIAGTFRPEWEIGKVVEVREEIFGDLGAESPDGFLGLKEMGFPSFRVEGKPIYNRMEGCDELEPVDSVDVAIGLTVNKVHGVEASIEAVQRKWNPDIESMEGAAFFQACLLAGVPFREFRSISNRVEKRDLSQWNIPLAVNNIQKWVWEWLQKEESV